MLISHPTRNISSCVLPRTPPKKGSRATIIWRMPASASSWRFHFLAQGLAQRPSTAPQYAGGDIVQRLLTSSCQERRCFGNLKHFLSSLTITTNTNTFLWAVLSFIFMDTGEYCVYTLQPQRLQRVFVERCWAFSLQIVHTTQPSVCRLHTQPSLQSADCLFNPSPVPKQSWTNL